MTQYQVNMFISQIPTVSAIFNIKEFVGHFMIENYQSGTEFEEYESEVDKLQDQCIGAGLEPPTSEE